MSKSKEELLYSVWAILLAVSIVLSHWDKLAGCSRDATSFMAASTVPMSAVMNAELTTGFDASAVRGDLLASALIGQELELQVLGWWHPIGDLLVDARKGDVQVVSDMPRISSVSHIEGRSDEREVYGRESAMGQYHELASMDAAAVSIGRSDGVVVDRASTLTISGVHSPESVEAYDATVDRAQLDKLLARIGSHPLGGYAKADLEALQLRYSSTRDSSSGGVFGEDESSRVDLVRTEAVRLYTEMDRVLARVSVLNQVIANYQEEQARLAKVSPGLAEEIERLELGLRQSESISEYAARVDEVIAVTRSIFDRADGPLPSE